MKIIVVSNIKAKAFLRELGLTQMCIRDSSTIANAKLNIGDCNGYGLEGIFRGRCKWGKYKDNECLQILSLIHISGQTNSNELAVGGKAFLLWSGVDRPHPDSQPSSGKTFLGWGPDYC